MGTLVIVGGAERRSRPEIYSAFLEAAGGPTEPIAIVPTAGGDPGASYEDTRDRLVAAGASADRVLPFGLEAHADSEEELRKLDRAAGVWFTGGDQNLLVASLGDRARSALFEKLDRGAVLGGTSAGAAVMSSPMIAGGTSFSALAPSVADDAVPFRLSPGLGFFGHGIVDQHFDARGRLGRLVMACLTTERRPGFGIAEDTALVVLEGQPWEVVGSGDVVVVDVDEVRVRHLEGLAEVTGIRLASLSAGDRFDPDARRVLTEAADLKGREYFAVRRPVSSGALSDHPSLSAFISRNLMDNDPAGLFESDAGPYARSYLIEGRPERGFELRFHRDGRSRGWHGTRGYGFEGVRMDILPRRVLMEAL